MSGAAYVPVEICLGALPEFHEEPKVYDLTGVPGGAKEMLVYTFVTVKGEEDNFQRGYYEISTADGSIQYTQYMNVAAGKDIVVLNSANLWLPMGEGKLKLKLVCADCAKGKKSIKGATPKDKEWSNVFIIGYRA